MTLLQVSLNSSRIEFTLDGIAGAVIISRVNGKFVYTDASLPQPIPVPTPDPVPVPPVEPPVPPTPPSMPIPATYSPLLHDCSAGVFQRVSPGVYFYRFTVPAGVYNAIYVSNDPEASDKWSEQMIVCKDGVITKADYDRMMASGKSTYAMGENNLWYVLKPAGSVRGVNLPILHTDDGVISTVAGKTTLTRNVDFTMILVAGDVGLPMPANARHKVRYCAILAPVTPQ